MLGKTEGKRRGGAAEDEMVGYPHRLNGHEFEQTPGYSEGQGSLVCYSPWGCKESDTSWQLNNNRNKIGNRLSREPGYRRIESAQCLIYF